jgi:hypothetical protein
MQQDGGQEGGSYVSTRGTLLTDAQTGVDAAAAAEETSTEEAEKTSTTASGELVHISWRSSWPSGKAVGRERERERDREMSKNLEQVTHLTLLHIQSYTPISIFNYM